MERRCVMSLHKLTAGDGYTYLTRQTAALDATERGTEGLGAYYAARVEAPLLGHVNRPLEMQQVHLIAGDLGP